MNRKARRRVRPEQIIGQSTTPVFWVSTDRRIAFFNSGCEKLTGWPADEVAGQLCEYTTDPRSGSLEALAASLCPPVEAFAGQIVSAPSVIACRTGEPQPRMLNFIPLLDDEGIVAGVLGVAGPIDSSSALAELGPAQELHADLAALRLTLARRFGTQSLICRSEEMLRVAGQMSIARGTRAPVLIWGEPGTGKEHIARAIHYESEWKTRALVPLDCSSLSPLDLAQALGRLFDPSWEEEYFASPAGLWPGTILLSHVEQLPRDLEQTVVNYFRSEAAERADLRLIAATTVEPSILAADENVRPDFYHLLTQLCIAVPPLRCRMSDLQHLAQHLLEESNRGQSRQFNGFGDDVWQKFSEYNWPGNVDELLAVIHEARGICNEPLIRAKDLPFRFRTGLDAQSVGPVVRPPVAELEPFLAQAEKEQIERALKQCRHNKSKAAKLLGMTRPRLYRRMEILGIRDEPASA
jgi:transcriptional regulator with PAS, ATPase and Fis domain